MTKAATWITLSEALSWLAFGKQEKADVLRSRLAANGYSDDDKKALQGALDALTDKARDDLVTMQGKLVPSATGAAAAIPTKNIPAIRLADFRAFDITTDGLRFGSGLPWLPAPQPAAHPYLTKYVAPNEPILLEKHYVEVAVNQTQLRKEHRRGQFGRHEHSSLPYLPGEQLKQWWDELSPEAKKLSERRLKEMLNEHFPENRVRRSRLRGLLSETPRKRGRPKNSLENDGE
jgi:hypothetical protein